MLKKYAFAVGLSAILLGTGRVHAQPEPKEAPSPEALQFFESKIRPLLAENCYKCHADQKQRGGMRLDSRAGMLAGGDLGSVLVPGSPEKSLIIKAINQTDADLKMPPDRKLTREQIADLTRWVKMGAPWPGGDKIVATPKRKDDFEITAKDRAHWSFQPIKRLPPPPVKNQAWVRNPIDAFILNGLEAKGMQPNPPADRLELLRRATFNLTGLPPTPAEVDVFLKDNSADAYEKLVDRLLDSPRYGEKWARHWLDLVHYAETNSYERDNPKPHIWRYRDYVIRALNADKPYDRFVREQLAGDELPDGGSDGLIATGFYRLGIWDDEPSDPVQARYDALDDIVATTGQVFLGLTVDCARCHNHKIDPIAQKDYYRLLAFFHNINHFRNGGPTDEAPLFAGPDGTRRYEALLRELQQQQNKLQAAITEIEQEFRTKAGKQPTVGNDLDDLRYKFYRGAWQKLPDFDNLKPEDTGKLPKQLFDISPRTRNTEYGFVFEGTLIVPAAAQYTFHLDSDDGSRLTVAGKTLLTYDGIHGTGTPKSVTVELAQGRLPIKLEYFQNVFGYGLEVAWSGPGFTQRPLSMPVDGKLTMLDFAQQLKREGPQVLGTAKFAQLQALRKELDGLKNKKPTGEVALVVTESGPRAPETFVALRGNPHVKGDKVEPGYLSVFDLPEPTLPNPAANSRTTGRRTVLADWLVSKDNRLTARVLVNRLWQHQFGRGIVRTPSDFGVQGARPTHPELLDWLATELMAQGWSMKKMHKLLMTSNAYRMSSRGQEQALKDDPQNDRYWRFDMRRLGAEEIRDSILAVSGNLNLKMHGPGIYPEIPKEVLAGQSVPGRGWGKSPPEEQARRSIYVHVKRSLLLPILESFDLAETDRTVPLRFSTTQPTQALALLNSEFMLKQAGIFAERLQKEAPGDLGKQVRLALHLATARSPSDAEVQRGLKLMEGLRTQDGASEELARQLYCLMVLNLNEFMYVD